MPYDPSPESDHGIYSNEPDLTDVSGTSDSNGTNCNVSSLSSNSGNNGGNGGANGSDGNETGIQYTLLHLIQVQPLIQILELICLLLEYK